MTRLYTLSAAAIAAAVVAQPALAQSAERDEKLPAQLPSVTIQGEDRSSSGAQGQTKVAPTAGFTGPRVRLPDPPQRRATSEHNRSLMVSVTPSTLEPPRALPGPVLPYTSLTGGYGPLTQYQLGLYDTRAWGPAVGITEFAGRSGAGFSEWRGKEWLDWTGMGRLSLQGNGFAWDRDGLTGNQLYLAGSAEHGESENMVAGVTAHMGQLDAGALTASLAGAYGQFRPDPMGDHQLTLRARAQARTWGARSGPEAMVEAEDFWSLSEAVQLEAGLGAGVWGFEPIVNPKVAFHYRPQSATHLYAGLRTATELPDFTTLYLRRPARSANADLAAERVEGWAEAGASHRFTDATWGSVTGELRRSHRHIYWADPEADGLWTPLNATTEQFQPGLRGQVRQAWAPGLNQSLEAGWRGVMPLGMSELKLGTGFDGSFLEDRLGVELGVNARMVSLSAQQTPGGGNGLGLFAEAEFSYAIQRDWRFSLTATDVPLALNQPSANYFAPIPLLSANVQYQF